MGKVVINILQIFYKLHKLC